MTRLILLALAGLICVPWSRADDPAATKATIAYVHKLQTSNGGFFSMAPQPNIRLAPTLRSTSAAVRALKYLGAEVPNKEACRKFVERCFDQETGGYADLPKGKADVFTTAGG